MPQFKYTPEDADPQSNYIGVVEIEYTFVGDKVDAHDHKSGHWMRILDGEIHVIVGDKGGRHKTGDWIFVPANVKHSMVSLTEYAASMCIMPREAFA